MPGTRALLFFVFAAALLAGCGGNGDAGGGDRSRPAPDAAGFPAVEGRSLAEIVDQGSGEAPVVSPAGRVLRVGENRFPFGVFTLGRDQITDAEVAIYAANGGPEAKAVGPFPARIEDLVTEPAFRAQTTSQDPDAAQVVYVANVPLPRPGVWSFAAVVSNGGDLSATLVPTPSKVGQFDQVPAVGERAPRVSTPTANDVTDISQIDTRLPPGTMHDIDFVDVVGKQPVVLLFATPSLCQSRVCGPVVDVAEQVKRDTGDGVAFIHQEIFVDNNPGKGVRPQVSAFKLPTEPWVFVIDGQGVIRAAIEGAFSVAELEQAVAEVAP